MEDFPVRIKGTNLGQWRWESSSRDGQLITMVDCPTKVISEAAVCALNKQQIGTIIQQLISLLLIVLK